MRIKGKVLLKILCFDSDSWKEGFFFDFSLEMSVFVQFAMVYNWNF